MSTGVKVFLIVVALILLIVVGAVGFGVYVWSQYGQRMIEGAQNARSEGQEFGGRMDNAGCLNEALSRLRTRPGFTDAIANNLFLNGCLESSRPTAGFCEGVPRTSEFRATIEWQVEQCREANFENNNFCGQIFQQVQQHCERSATSTTSPPGAARSPTGK